MSRFGLSSRLLALAASLLALTSHAAAAQSAGSVRGTIKSTEHGVLTAARASIESPARAVYTDAKGKYEIREVPAGHYEVVFTALGYEPLRKQVDVVGGKATDLDIDLTPGSLLLSSVITTATRTPTEAGHVAATVNVLTQQQVRTSAARETQDLIREIPAVELKRQSSLVDGSAQIVSIRGVDEGRTVVLADGIPISDAWGEWIDWGRLPKGMIDHVEVVEGGTSNLYGNGAMGGVISFFSRPWAPMTGTLTVDGGSRDAQHVFVAGGIPIWKALTATVSGDYTAGGGYRMLDSLADHPSLRPGPVDLASESVQRNALVRLNYAPSAKWSGFLTGHLFGDTRHTGTWLSRTARDFKQVDLGLTRGSFATGQLSLRAWDGQQEEDQRASAIRANSTTCTPSATVARVCEDSSLTAVIPSHDWGASVVWSRSNVMKMLESITAGADYRHMSGSFDETDFNTTCPGANCGVVSRTIVSGGAQALSGVFVQAIVAPLPRTTLELGARGDRWDNSDAKASEVIGTTPGTHAYPDASKSAFSPRVGLRYDVPVPKMLGNLALHAAYYNAFRAPNLAELYRKQISATSITLPNPDLKPEYALGREGGFVWQPIEMLQLKATYYVADYKDFNVPTTLPVIAGDPKPAECGAVATCRQRLNLSRARSKGAEGYVAIRPIRSLFISAAANYDEARQRSGLAAGVPLNKGPHVNRVPSPRQTIRVMYSSQMLGDWTAIWKHEGVNSTLQGVRLDPFTVYDINVQRDIVNGVRGFVAVENVGDTKFLVNKATAGAVTTLQYGMPRTVRVGLTLTRN